MGGEPVEKRTFVEEEGRVRLVVHLSGWLRPPCVVGARRWSYASSRDGATHARRMERTSWCIARDIMKNRNRWENSGERKVFVIKTRF